MAFLESGGRVLTIIPVMMSIRVIAGGDNATAIDPAPARSSVIYTGEPITLHLD